MAYRTNPKFQDYLDTVEARKAMMVACVRRIYTHASSVPMRTTLADAIPKASRIVSPKFHPLLEEAGGDPHGHAPLHGLAS